MLLRTWVSLAVVFSAGILPVRAQPSPSPPGGSAPAEQEAEKKSPPKMYIGALKGLSRPGGFGVEDLRSAQTKASSAFVETYRAPFSPFRQPVPLAKYERILGDEELSVSPVDLLAEALVERYGDGLKGKRLAVHEFSYKLEQVVNKPQSMTYTVVGGSLASAIALSAIGSAAGTAMMQGRGIELKLHVKIVAELDGKRIEASELPMSLSGPEGAFRVTRFVVARFQHAFDPPPPDAPAEEKPEGPEKD